MNALTPLTWHQKVACIGTMMRETLPQADTPIKHIFEPGVYVREITIPAGVLFIGRPHRFGHHIRFLEGRFKMIANGEEQMIEAPYEIWTRPGFLMVLETYTFHRGRTYHPNPDECRDTGLMENLIFHPAEEMLQVGHSARALLESAT